MYLDKRKVIKRLIGQALEEDIGRGDVTTFFAIPASIKVRALIIAKEKGVLCGIDVAKNVFKYVDGRLSFKPFKKDGNSFKKGTKIVRIEGKAHSILSAERVALNFLSYLSGIATHTKEFAKKIKNTRTKIMDTRKTTPTLRILEKYAVKTGGGKNHRYGLWDGILLKDNHLRASGIIKNRHVNETILKNILNKLRKNAKFPIEIEVENIVEFKKVIKYKPAIIMLDNFNLFSLKKAVVLRNKYYPSIKLEASGGIDLSNVKKIAKTGIDFISVGTITHSSRAIDFSLEIK